MASPMEQLLERRRDAKFRLFRDKFSAEVRITVGSATCENAAGSDAVRQRFKELLDQHKPEHVVMGNVGCSGKCDMEPVVLIVRPGEIPVKYVHMTPARVDEVFAGHVINGQPVEKYTMRHESGLPAAERVISVCEGANCRTQSAEIQKAFRDALAAAGLSDKVAVTPSACQGLCAVGPVAYVYPDDVMYQNLTPAVAVRIVKEHLLGEIPCSDHIWKESRVTNRFAPLYGDVYFFGKQLRITLRNCGVIDPESLDEYLAVRGYEAAVTAMTSMTPMEVINAITKSGLRGRGGGGFPTGVKWNFAASQVNDTKYIICNADEGDPGAFMDRSTIEGDPHTIVEATRLARSRALSTSAQNTRWLSSASKRRLQTPALRASSARAFLARPAISMSKSASAPALSCAARRRP